MNISLNWLKQYIDLPKTVKPAELGLKLTMATVEVEEVTDLAASLENIVVGQITKIGVHPNADRLRLTEVNIGSRIVKVVCGGINLTEGMLVAQAMPGAKVRWHGEGEPIVLEIAKVRGEESEGMICTSAEIGLASMFPAKEDAEIVDLSNLKCKVGTNLAEALGLNDAIYEIDNKSVTNRPDLWGHYGMAREVAAIYDLKLKKYSVEKIVGGKELDLKVKVENKAACPRYMAVALSGIKIGPSPEWLQKRLLAIGQKPINNVVDVTNYVMYDLGQPMHAFSADKIVDHDIIVRSAHDGEKITTLDGIERKLHAEDLVIATKDKAVALAGIMGNENSQIADNSEDIILESATFDPVVIRRTSSRLGLRTEASIRFEKSLDSNIAELAILKAVNLIQAMMPEVKVVSSLIDINNYKNELKPIEIDFDFINRRIGADLGQDKIIKILTNLGFGVKATKKSLKVTIPSWRATKDVNIKEDLIEEITRIYGYDNLTPEMPPVKIEYKEPNELRNLERQIKNILALQFGANEVYNYSFVDRTWLAKIGFTSEHIELQNPWAENVNLMRRSLVPNLLENAINNFRFFDEVNLFEVGKTFIENQKGPIARPEVEANLPTQDVIAGGLVSGVTPEEAFLKAKGMVEALLNKVQIKASYNTQNAMNPWCHPNQFMQVLVGKDSLGYFSVVHPEVAQNIELNKPVAVWEINLNLLLQYSEDKLKYKTLAKYPGIELDLSILVAEKTAWQDIQKLVLAVDPKIIKDVRLLDVFKNDKIEAGKKSVTFRIVYQADEKTLEMETVLTLQKKIIEQLGKAVGAEVRQ